MNDTVTRLMALADKAIAAQDQRLGYLAQDYRQALQDELTRLFEPVVEPVAWCALSIGGKTIAYFDGKPIIMVGKVGNDCHPHPLYTWPPTIPAEVVPCDQ